MGVQDLLFGDFMGTFGWPIVGGITQGVQSRIGNVLNWLQQKNALGYLDTSHAEQESYYDTNAANAQTQYGALVNTLLGNQTAAAGQIQSGYADLTKSALANLEGLGDASRTKINEDYSDYGNKVAADISNRGLGNTSLMSSQSRAVEKDRRQAVNALDESIRGQRLNVETNLGLNSLSALQNSLNSNTNLATSLGLGGMDLYNNLWTSRLGNDQNYAAQRLSTMLGYTINAPDPVNWGDVGTSIANAYAAKEARESASSGGNFTTLGGGLGMAGGLGIAAAMPGAMTLPMALAGMGIGTGAGAGLGSLFGK